MFNVLYIEPGLRNPGDRFILEGLLRVTEQVLGKHNKIFIDPENYDPIIEVIDFAAVDYVFLSGTPWIWDQCENSKKYRTTLNILNKFPKQKKIAAGVGSCLPLNEKEDLILKNENTVCGLKEFFGQFCLVLTRDRVAQDILEKIGIKSTLSKCPSIYLAGDKEVVPERAVVVYYDPMLGISRDCLPNGFLDSYLALIKKIQKDFNARVFCITKEEWEKGKELIKDLEFISEPQKILNMLSKAKVVFSGRVHSAVVAAALHIPSYVIPVDSRYLTAVECGSKVIDPNKGFDSGQVVNADWVFPDLRLEFGKLSEILQETISYTHEIEKYKSESSLCRSRLRKYCLGYGVDLGYGGDPIVPEAITVDMPVPYTKMGIAPLNLGGDARNLYWFKDGVLDYVYSSHLLEDFEDTESVLREWLRVLKKGGYLIIYCPDEKVYREHCKKTNQPYNLSHKIENFSLDYLLKILKKIGSNEIIHFQAHCEAYSFELVARKTSFSFAQRINVFQKKFKDLKILGNSQIKWRYLLINFCLNALYKTGECLFDSFAANRKSCVQVDQAKRILVIRLDHLGDVLLSTPALMALRQRFPKAHIAFLVGPWSVGIVQGNPFIDEIIIADVPWHRRGKDRNRGNLWKVLETGLRLLPKRFELAIDLRGESKETILAYLSGAKYRLSYQDIRVNLLLTHKVRRELKYCVEENLNVVRSLGADTENKKMVFVIPEAAVKRVDVLLTENAVFAEEVLIGIHPGAGNNMRYLPEAICAEVADALAEKYKCRIILTGSKDEKALLEKISALMRKKPVCFAGKLNISELAVLIKKLRLFIASDSGPMHISVALDTPTIEIFGPGNLTRFASFARPNIVITKNLSCSPCGDLCKYGEPKCLQMINAQEIISAAQRLMKISL